MAPPPKLPGRVVGRSKTGINKKGTPLRLDDPLDKGYLCQKICRCDKGTALVSKSGQTLKQRCVSASIWVDEELNQLVWRYKAEVGFNMRARPPAPLMSRAQPNRPSRFPLGAAIGQGVLKRTLEGKFQKGLLRIPDCIILKVTGPELAAMRAGGTIIWKRLIPTKNNIETVLEVKFPGDKLTQRQMVAYQRIAGADRFRLLEVNDCDCGGRKREQPTTQPVRAPVTTPMPHFEPLIFLPPFPPNYPPPQPVRPQYGPVVLAEESTALSSILKAVAVTGGVILVGVIVVAVLPELAVGAAVVAIGRTAVALISLAVASNTATAAPSTKKELK